MRVTLVFLLAGGVAALVYFVFFADPISAEAGPADAGVVQPASPLSEPGNKEAELEFKPEEAKLSAGAGLVGDPVNAPASKTARALGPRATIAPAIRALAYAPTATMAKSFGWSLRDPRTSFLAHWHRDTRSQVRELCDEIDRTAHREQRRVRARFNERVAEWRTQLLTRLGESDAVRVLKKYPLYRFDLERPQDGWHRVDARGRKIPFAHDDEQRWEGFELRDR